MLVTTRSEGDVGEDVHDETPRVTIAILAFNHDRFVEQAVEAALAQTYPNCSVILFDDASSDDTTDVVRALADRPDWDFHFVAHETNRGICATVNEAVDLATGEFMALISADDWMEPDRIERQVAEIVSCGEDCGAVYSDFYRVNEQGDRLDGTALELQRLKNRPPVGEVYLSLLRWNWMPTPTVLIRRSVFDNVGRYDESLPYEDWDMWLRISRRYSFACVPVALVNRRELATSMTKQLSADPLPYGRARATILEKQLGASPEADRIIAGRLVILMVKLRVQGAEWRDVLADLRVIMKRHGVIRSLGSAVVETFFPVKRRVWSLMDKAF